MRKLIDLIYYRFYRFQISVGNGQIAVLFALLFLSFLILVNIVALIYIIYGVAGFMYIYDDVTVQGLALTGGIISINAYLFIYKKRYKIIIKQYKNETKAEVRLGNIKIIIYILISFIMLGVGLYSMVHRNN